MLKLETDRYNSDEGNYDLSHALAGQPAREDGINAPKLSSLTKTKHDPENLARDASREDDQKALRAAALEDALRGAKAHIEGTLFDMNPADHPDELLAEIDRALAGSTAGEGREDNQEQQSGKGSK